MIYSIDGLRKDTVALIREINAEIELIRKQEANEADRLGARRSDQPDPKIRLATLLNAKATAYNTLVMLQEPRPRGGHTATQHH